MSEMPYRKVIFSLTAVLFILIGVLAILINMPVASDEISRKANGHVSGTADIGGHFTLVNQDGVLTDSRTIDEDYKLVFFGFTYCPDVCPATLQKITLALSALGPKADKIRPVFISVDPERDAPDVIKTYLTAFHPRLAGFTGTPEQVRDVQERYRVYAQKAQSEGAKEYLVDHSAYIYLTGSNDMVIDVISADLGIAEISDAIAGVLD